MKNSRKAQALIEYATMATLVTVGILFMGPYVVRSINAFFRSAGNDVQDSLREEVTQAPSEGFNLPSCACGGFQETICGGTPCNPRQMMSKRNCTPLACERLMEAGGTVIRACEYREGCCTPWTETGNCGPDANTAPAGAGHVVGGCPVGEMEYTRECGGDDSGGTKVWVCQSACQGQMGCPAPPHQTCVELCYDSTVSGGVRSVPDPIPLKPNSAWCPGDQTGGLAADTPMSYVREGNCVAGSKCQAYCKGGLLPSTDGTSCSCPASLVEDNGFCVCPRRFFPNCPTCRRTQVFENGCISGWDATRNPEAPGCN